MTVSALPGRPSATPPRKVLHVGCGPRLGRTLHQTFRSADWQEIRLDIDPKVKPDIVCSIIDMSVVEDASVDAVWSRHNIEHLYAHEVPKALSEFQRVLKPGGFALITLPDLQQVARYIADGRLEDVLYESANGPIRPIDIVYGHCGFIARGDVFMAHKTGFTVQTLGTKMVQAGFRPVSGEAQSERVRTLGGWVQAICVGW